MNNSPDIVKSLKERYFWDAEVSKLDAEASKRLIIERVFSLGSVSDMQAIILHYGRKEVVDVLCRLNYLDPKTLNFVSKLFNTPREHFQCYTRKQSSPQHWNS